MNNLIISYMAFFPNIKEKPEKKPEGTKRGHAREKKPDFSQHFEALMVYTHTCPYTHGYMLSTLACIIAKCRL